MRSPKRRRSSAGLDALDAAVGLWHREVGGRRVDAGILAMASNVLTLAAKGNVSYSVSLTTMATPFRLWSFLGVVPDLKANWTSMPEALQSRRFRGCFCKSFCRWFWGISRPETFPRWDLTNRFAAVIANLVIPDHCRGRERQSCQSDANSHHQLWDTLGNALGDQSLGYGAGWLGAKLMNLPESQQRALIIEIGMQNAGLGSILATQLFPINPPSPYPPPSTPSAAC